MTYWITGGLITLGVLLVVAYIWGRKSQWKAGEKEKEAAEKLRLTRLGEDISRTEQFSRDFELLSLENDPIKATAFVYRPFADKEFCIIEAKGKSTKGDETVEYLQICRIPRYWYSINKLLKAIANKVSYNAQMAIRISDQTNYDVINDQFDLSSIRSAPELRDVPYYPNWRFLDSTGSVAADCKIDSCGHFEAVFSMPDIYRKVPEVFQQYLEDNSIKFNVRGGLWFTILDMEPNKAYSYVREFLDNLVLECTTNVFLKSKTQESEPISG